MPRIPRHLFRQAYRTQPQLAKLLPVCRTLSSAQNELRWLKEYVQDQHHIDQQNASQLLKSLVRRRATGVPLQYLLGSEYFGDLEIACRPGVLIPRQETAASVSHLVRRLQQLLPPELTDGASLRVLDVCTGTGCIPLLFHHEFYSQPSNSQRALNLTAVDISDAALNLSRFNQERQIDVVRHRATHGRAALEGLRFIKADVLAKGDSIVPDLPSLEQVLASFSPEQRKFDVLISNPPYISDHDYRTITATSVRRFEPKLALVPHYLASPSTVVDGDQFYPRLLSIADIVQAHIVLLEVGDMSQAVRVADIARSLHTSRIVEIWRDDPVDVGGPAEMVQGVYGTYSVIGNGNARSVFTRRH